MIDLNFTQCDVLLKSFGSWQSHGCYFDVYHPPKHWCTPNISSSQKAVTSQQKNTMQTTKTAQEQLEEHDQELKALIWLPNSKYLSLMKHLQNISKVRWVTAVWAARKGSTQY